MCPDSYDGPPAWWAARQRRVAARRPLCDEYGTPAEYEDDDGDAEDSDADADEGEGEE